MEEIASAAISLNGLGHAQAGASTPSSLSARLFEQQRWCFSAFLL